MGTEKDPLKVGDRVLITAKCLPKSGDYGTVTEAGSGDWHLVIHHGETIARCYTRESLELIEAATEKSSGPVKSDGGSTSYYAIPEGAVDLLDLIDHKRMTFGVGNVFKACYRLGEKDGTDAEYDLNKIIFFAQREKEKLRKKRLKGR